LNCNRLQIKPTGARNAVSYAQIIGLSVNRVNFKLELPVFPVWYVMGFAGYCCKPAPSFGVWGGSKEASLGLNILQTTIQKISSICLSLVVFYYDVGSLITSDIPAL
jgi:hypothetical protein